MSGVADAPADLDSLAQTGILQDAVRSMADDDVGRDREMPPRERAVPDLVTSFAMADECAAGLPSKEF